MNIQANLPTLIIGSLALAIALPVHADSFRSDHQKPAWRTKQDDRRFDNSSRRGEEDCGRGQDCTTPDRRSDSPKQRQKDAPRLKRAPSPEPRPATRFNKRDDRDQPTLPSLRERRDAPKLQSVAPFAPIAPPAPPTRHEARDQRHPRPIATLKRPRHRITYNNRIRHNYRYIRGPWYNTRYIAPLPIRFHKIGYRINVLPRSYIRIMIGGFPYFYYTGVFYRPFGTGYIVVAAPIGAFVDTLPDGFIAFSIGLSTYYYVNDTYYLWDEAREGYLVVDEPAGASAAIAKATTGRLMVYPNAGQSEEQQAKDRYECHRWAVTESGIDPTLEEQEYAAEDNDNYRRALAACLEGRDYTVK